MGIHTIVEPVYEAECDRCHTRWPVSKDEPLPLVPMQLPLTEAGPGAVVQICQDCDAKLRAFIFDGIHPALSNGPQLPPPFQGEPVLDDA